MTTVEDDDDVSDELYEEVCAIMSQINADPADRLEMARLLHITPEEFDAAVANWRGTRQ